MLSIVSPMQQDAIQKLLTDYQGEDLQFVFKEKQGIKLLFEVLGVQEQAVKIAKDLIKAQPWGGILTVQVTLV